MNGNSIGALNVYKVEGNSRELIWTKSGSQGSAWKHAGKRISSKSDYQVQDILWVLSHTHTHTHMYTHKHHTHARTYTHTHKALATASSATLSKYRSNF